MNNEQSHRVAGFFISSLSYYLMHRAKLDLDKSINVDTLLYYAHYHRLSFLFAHIYHLPSDFKAKYRSLVIKNTSQYLQMKRCLINILREFNQQKIACIVLKGIPLNIQLYDDQSVRFSKDIDLLVPQESLTEAHQALVCMGFKLQSPLTPVEMSYISAPIYAQLKDLTYRNVDGIEVELHWQTCVTPRFSIRYADKYTDKKVIMNTVVLVFTKELNFLYLVMHASVSHWKRIQMVMDIACFYQKYQLHLHWESILSLAMQKNAMRCLYEAKVILAYFGVRILDVPMNFWGRWIVNLHFSYVKYLWRDIGRWNASQSQLMRFIIAPNLSQRWSWFKTSMLFRQVCQRSLKRTPNLSQKRLFFISVLNLLSVKKEICKRS